MAHFVFAFSLLFIFWPRLLFASRGEGLLDDFFARYIKMVCLLIILSYLLVIVQLYEVLSLVFCLLVITLRSKLIGGRTNLAVRALSENALIWLYDVLDRERHPLAELKSRAWKRYMVIKAYLASRFSTPLALGNTLLLLSVLGYSAYLRFYDSVRHAAPAMSDAYVTLAWMKYIDEKILFHDGIYPQGFHIYLSVLHKFATNDPLYVLKYAGPLNGVLIILGIYFFVSRLSGRVLPGIIAAFIYGVLGGMLPMGWERQASTNSQEFALVFLLPAWYFTLAYFKTRKKDDLWTAAAAYAVIGLVHPLVLAFLCVGVAILVIAQLLVKPREAWQSLLQLLIAGGVAAVVTVLPLAYGFLLGKEVHSSSLDFVTMSLQLTSPEISLLDKAALGGLLVFLLAAVLLKAFGKPEQELGSTLFVCLLGGLSFAGYMFLGPLTQNAVLSTRTGLLWSLAAVVVVGLGWWGLFRVWQQRASLRLLELGLGVGLLLGAVWYYQPAPPEPYKMQYDTTIEQYLQIRADHTPTDWLIVSTEEGYALSIGRGWHMHLGDFLEAYDPGNKRLSALVDGTVQTLTVSDIFLFSEKNPYPVDIDTMEPVIERHEQEYARLEQWVEEYDQVHNNLDVYYEDQNIIIYQIHQTQTQADRFREIWGGGEVW